MKQLNRLLRTYKNPHPSPLQALLPIHPSLQIPGPNKKKWSMGNCLKRPSTSSSDDEDDRYFYYNKEEEEEMRLLKPAGAKTDQLKIKVTKKELEELLGRADMVGMSTVQLLVELVKVKGEFEVRHRPWKPSLQSIPEID